MVDDHLLRGVARKIELHSTKFEGAVAKRITFLSSISTRMAYKINDRIRLFKLSVNSHIEINNNTTTVKSEDAR